MNFIEVFLSLEVVLITFIIWFKAIQKARGIGNWLKLSLILFIWPYSFYYLYKSFENDIRKIKQSLEVDDNYDRKRALIYHLVFSVVPPLPFLGILLNGDFRSIKPAIFLSLLGIWLFILLLLTQTKWAKETSLMIKTRRKRYTVIPSASVNENIERYKSLEKLKKAETSWWEFWL